MSDRLQDLAKHYEDTVLNEYPRSIGLFPIPEYPEWESNRGMWSSAWETLLTTLRYLAPATLLTLFWGQESFLFKLLKSIDSAFRAIAFSSDEQKQEVLQWLAEAGPVQIEHLETVWRHGWILCGVLDAALPGACAGHPPTRLTLKHAQTIADHYLGVKPVFTPQELESNDALTRHQEWKLAAYLDRIRQALAKLTPPVSKPQSQRTSPETTQFTLDYVAKGSGLKAAQIKNKMHFKIYPTSQQSLNPGEITVLIRGPKDTYGMSIVPPVLGKAQLLRQKVLGLQPKPNLTENALPITQGTTYLRNYGKNDMNKTYYIPKSQYNIDIDTVNAVDHAKVSYTVSIEGKYDIFITSGGQNIVGSPFTMTASNNILDIFEKESDLLEDGEEIDIVDVKTDRKVILRIVDFVTEKMLLKENGVLEKITDEEAKALMSTENPLNDDNEHSSQKQKELRSTDYYKNESEINKFKKLAHKVLKMNRVCKVITDLVTEKATKAKKKYSLEQLREKDAALTRPRSQQDIPDIVNSTLSENSNPFITEKRDNLITPQNINVSLRTEIPVPRFEKELTPRSENTTPEGLTKLITLESRTTDNVSMERKKSSSNPFLNDSYDYRTKKKLGSFVKTEYETNNSQNEETENVSIKILIDEEKSLTPSPININPFAEPDIILERPKTPVLKIITGEVNRDDVYVDPILAEQVITNEFINPFFLHHRENQTSELPIADFIIGAPVSLPPFIRVPTPETNLESIILTQQEDTKVHINEDINSSVTSVFSTPVHINKAKSSDGSKPDNHGSPISSTFHSLDSNIADKIDIVNSPKISEYDSDKRCSQNITPKKDTWDSAYVSIDENNSSPDTNNNDNQLSEISTKQSFCLSDNHYDFSKMGPAEREIWQAENQTENIQDYISKQHEEIKSNKCDVKRPIFTPILEESDRSMSTGLKESIRSDIIENVDLVPVAFAELKKAYGNYLSNYDGRKPKFNEIKNSIKDTITKLYEGSVDSASEIPDVKRHAEKSEGKTSEVQANATESISVSQTLQPFKQTLFDSSNDKKGAKETHKRSTIVLEKKQYWDERIREIEAMSEENNIQQKSKKLSARHLRQNDSLTKRRAKQLGKTLSNTSNNSQQEYNLIPGGNNHNILPSPASQASQDEPKADEKLVDKWKKYWDSKLETDKESDTTHFRAKSPKSNESSPSPQRRYVKDEFIEKDVDLIKSKTPSPIKQELPEEVFKAFETSPKRFFGTSRKQILSKIDNFLGKLSTADESYTDVGGATQHDDTGLVSSRISLFHNISHTEDLPRSQMKCLSMQNVSRRRDSEKSNASVEDRFISSFETFVDENGTPSEAVNKYPCTIEPTKQHDAGKGDSSLKDKRARMTNKMCSFEETMDKKQTHIETQIPSVKKVIIQYNKNNHGPKINYALRKSSFSRSEMDIFKKFEPKPEQDDFDKHKSYDELPKINVKNVISLYESVSKVDVNQPEWKSNLKKHNSCSSGTVNVGVQQTTTQFPPMNHSNSVSAIDLRQGTRRLEKRFGSVNFPPKLKSENNTALKQSKELETAYDSLSDIEVEIIEKKEEPIQPEKQEVDKNEQSSEPNAPIEPEISQTDYKKRFKMAKEFFQSMDETECKKPKKLNECELLLLKTSIESTESLKKEDVPQKKCKIKKSHSLPSSEMVKYWNQMQEENRNCNKLVKISEKFNVEDLFNDVMEGRLSRQGSLKGIPHKKAVLETFKSMENINDSKVSPYEIAVSQLHDISNENKIKNVQTYLSEYPYLPTTDPSRYQSRLDTKATGLISLKELMDQKKPRRNSVPDLRLNTKFTVKL